MTQKKRAIRDLRIAIVELIRAVRSLRQNNFEQAEDRIAVSLILIGVALRRINRAEND